jgi:DNA-binding response OmpR family regulator
MPPAPPPLPLSPARHAEPGSTALDSCVPLLRWPEEEAARRRLAAVGAPRLLLVGADAEPPDVVDELEDWLREPLNPGDVEARRRTLHRRRARRVELQPEIDADGLLRFGDRWVALPESQLPVVRLLLHNANQVVRTEDLVHAYVQGGGSGTESSIKALVSRLAPRLRDVGLRLHTVRRRGLILEVPSAARREPAHDPDPLQPAWRLRTLPT